MEAKTAYAELQSLIVNLLEQIVLYLIRQITGKVLLVPGSKPNFFRPKASY
jgi:hypothetical protein